MKLTPLVIMAACATFSLVQVTPARAAPPTCGTEDLLAGKLPAEQHDLLGNPALVTDGAVVQDGATWDGPAAVKLEGGSASITYDLGKPTAVSAIHLQADANDSYRISGSLDGRSGTFKLLVEAANVVERGHGMRSRSLQFAPVTVRYLRVGEADGDGAFSISELAAYCKAPTPFPPGFKVVDVAPASNPDAQAPPPPGSDTGRWALLLTAVALALAWLAYKTITRPSATESDSDADTSADAAAKAADKPVEKTPGDSDKPET